MRRKLKLGLAVVAFLAVTFLFFAFYYAGAWLKKEEIPVKADAIVILAGPPSRALCAADLYTKGFAPIVYISRPVREGELKLLDTMGIDFPRMEDIVRQILLKKDVPEGSIRFLGKNSVSTAGEAETCARIFSGNGCRILIVTSPYHVRRTRLIFEQHLRNCDFRVIGTSYEPFPEKWWKDQDAARNVILEVLKMVFYVSGGRFQPPPDTPGIHKKGAL